eukprot:TRINITY_DN57354_c0_g1_i1.p1 TRINITY_DN57354_c0_g1~~TRINITY_DN57354_c0_g1_i1.p1  ORF type:complete len:686 (-),score=100.59 TRINITY_DN57354_c0_g1_i1:26-2083(-)
MATSPETSIACAHCSNALRFRSLNFFEGRFLTHKCASCQADLGRQGDRWCCPRGCDFCLCESCVSGDAITTERDHQRTTETGNCEGCGGALGVRAWETPLCKSCYYLGSGEGGMVKTASIDEVSKMLGREASLETMWDHTDPTVEEPFVSPRVEAHGFDFGLSIDEEAQRHWDKFAFHGVVCKSGEAAPALLAAAQTAAKHLRFLELTVMSQNDLRKQQGSNKKENCLELYSACAGIPKELKETLISEARRVTQASRAMGALVGMAVADALGAPFEFIDAVNVPGSSGSIFDLQSFRRVGVLNRFRTKEGQWTDDSSMGLCLADSLLARGTYDGSDVRVRYHNWWFRGYNNAFGNDDSRIGSIGLGGNVSKSLRAMRADEPPPPCYESLTQDAGNGSLMRLAAVPIFYSHDPVVSAHQSAKSSLGTHPGPIAAAACAFYGYAIAKAVMRNTDAMTSQEFLDAVVEEFKSAGLPGAEDCPELLRLLQSSEPPGKEECWNWRGPELKIQESLRARGRTYNGYPCYPDYYGSYCIDGLAVALWSFYHTGSFMEAITRCVNFLGDADTTAAICGQLAGAFYGYDAIDERCIEDLEVWDDMDVACRGALLYVHRELVSGALQWRDAEAAIRGTFKSWDTSGTNTISKAELEKVFLNLGMEQAFVDRIFVEMDADKNGSIDYDEFISWVYS